MVSEAGIETMQDLLQSSLDSAGNNEALGLNRSEMQELIQTIQSEGKEIKEIQVCQL